MPPPNELNPLIKRLELSSPGLPERLLAITPDMRPAIAFETFADAFCVKTPPLTDEIAPVVDAFF
ncbi:hypothetical protein D3C85_833170 [compost metagenome]